MSTPIEQLIETSRYYGALKDFVIAGGGNTSYKNDEHLWIKASGTTLANITEEGFVVLDRRKLAGIPGQTFSHDADTREQQVKDALYASCLRPDPALRPSVETNLHDIIGYSYVVHLHPTLVNALLMW
jgi:rhamnose utilization protein RhaD (predicted bifunctional aldolase and dehydrogenase)